MNYSDSDNEFIKRHIFYQTNFCERKNYLDY